MTCSIEPVLGLSLAEKLSWCCFYLLSHVSMPWHWLSIQFFFACSCHVFLFVVLFFSVPPVFSLLFFFFLILVVVFFSVSWVAFFHHIGKSFICYPGFFFATLLVKDVTWLSVTAELKFAIMELRPVFSWSSEWFKYSEYCYLKRVYHIWVFSFWFDSEPSVWKTSFINDGQCLCPLRERFMF